MTSSSPPTMTTSPPTAASMTPRLASAFRSARLVYHPMEDSPDVRTFCHDAFQHDPVGTGLANPSLLRPATRAAADDALQGLRDKCALAVLICLPASSPAPPDSSDDDAQPTRIGFLTLSHAPPHARAVSLGIRLAPAHQGRGYGPEAIAWALDWAFRWGDVHRVGICSVAFNDRALRLYRSLGFVDEGRTRQACYFDCAWHDMVHLGMLEHEWKALRKIG